ncbi:hypothetical protein LB505_013333 [Fusarium chuoi]|nr:hypothetical protein LB505_013333 [Fusarium chuoi]QGI75375.1 hypothetical protein CEK25_000281 [Fusarium fujikuroi]
MDPNEQPSWAGGDAPDKEKMEQARPPDPRETSRQARDINACVCQVRREQGSRFRIVEPLAHVNAEAAAAARIR